MPAWPPLCRKHDFCWLVCAGMAIALASCGGGADDPVPGTQGGVGQVVSLNGDGAPNSADGGRDGRGSVGGSGGAAATGGSGGRSVGAGGAIGGASGAGGRGGGVGGGGGTGGAGGSGPTDDPCTACEKAKCSHPAGLTADKTDNYAELVGAYEVCFLGTGWPSAQADPANFCVGQGETAVVAMNGPEIGTAKTTLCQDLLKCVHETSCNGGPDIDNQPQCYCGAGVSIQTCSSTTFTPTGACVAQVAGALEATVFSNSEGYFGDVCLANGAAFFLYDLCDTNCCETACGLSPSGFEDPTFCNMPGSGGTSGSGGTFGSAGTTGTGTGGRGAAGSSGTGGSTHGGGTSGSGGVSGAGGSRGAAGSGGSSGGAAGSSGGSANAVLQNVHFDTNVVSWMPGLGVTLTRSPNDAAGSAQSGSLDLFLSGGDLTIATQASAAQCLSVTAGATYNLGVTILIPGQTASQGGLGLWYYPSSDCSGAIAGVFSSPSSTTAAWQRVSATAQIPAGVQSAAVRVVVLKPYGQQTAEALFDDVLVQHQ
jgi:hypothetical protein